MCVRHAVGHGRLLQPPVSRAGPLPSSGSSVARPAAAIKSTRHDTSVALRTQRVATYRTSRGCSCNPGTPALIKRRSSLHEPRKGANPNRISSTIPCMFSYADLGQILAFLLLKPSIVCRTMMPRAARSGQCGHPMATRCLARYPRFGLPGHDSALASAAPLGTSGKTWT